MDKVEALILGGFCIVVSPVMLNIGINSFISAKYVFEFGTKVVFLLCSIGFPLGTAFMAAALSKMIK